MIAPFLGATMASVALGEIVRVWLRASAVKPVQRAEEIMGMSEYEILGADTDALEELLSGEFDIVGEDDDDLLGSVSGYEIVGAAPNRKQQLARAVAAKNAVVVKRSAPTARRRLPLGFAPTVVGIGATAQIPAAPQNSIRGETLCIPSDIAFDVSIVDIKVGNASQLVEAVELPGAMYTEVSRNNQLSLDSAQLGSQLSIQVRNNSVAALTFRAGIVGTVVK
jgi:hypothetical protein